MKRLSILLLSLPIAATAGPIDFSGHSGERAFENDLWFCDDATNAGCGSETLEHGQNLERVLDMGKHELCFDCWNPQSNENAWNVKLTPLGSKTNQSRVRDEIVLASTNLEFDSSLIPDFADGRPFGPRLFDPEDARQPVPEPSTSPLNCLTCKAMAI